MPNAHTHMFRAHTAMRIAGICMLGLSFVLAALPVLADCPTSELTLAGQTTLTSLSRDRRSMSTCGTHFCRSADAGFDIATGTFACSATASGETGSTAQIVVRDQFTLGGGRVRARQQRSSCAYGSR